jgi:hypothetical protein
MPRRFNRRKKTFRRKSSQFKRKRAYAPKNKAKFVRRSNPISENKKVEATDITRDVGVNLLNTDILHDFSEEPRYVGNEPPLLGGEDLAVAGLPTGARGVPLRDAVFNFNPDSALYQTQGTDSNSMIGSSSYMKLTAAKFLIRWPQPSMNTGKWNGRITDMPDDDAPLADKVAWLKDPLNNHMGIIPTNPQTYHLYWGFIRTPTGYSDFTTPKKHECSANDLERHINLRVEEWFNQRTDRISFIPKVNNNMKIIGKRKLSPPWDHRNGRLPTSTVDISEIDGDPVTRTVTQGVIPDTMVKITWPHNKKVHFTKTNNFSGDGVDANGAPESGVPVFYRNHDWLPFACIVNWNAASLPQNASRELVPPGSPFTAAEVQRDVRVPHVLVNDITYYRDS